MKNKVILWKHAHKVSFYKDLSVINNRRMKIIMKIIVLRSRLKTTVYAEVTKSCLSSVGERRVVIENLQLALTNSWKAPSVSRKRRVGVLISGSGMLEETS